jgi:hypothetical protein
MGNACIGLMNHKFFILYLLYINFYFASIVLISVRVLWFTPIGEDGDKFNPTLRAFDLLSGSPNQVIVFLLAFVLLFGMTIFFVFQVVLLL